MHELRDRSRFSELLPVTQETAGSNPVAPATTSPVMGFEPFFTETFEPRNTFAFGSL